MTTRPTGRAVGLLAGAVAFLIVGFILGLAEFAALTIAALALLTLSWLLVSGGGLVTTRTDAPMRVERGEQASVRVIISASGRHRAGVRVIDNRGSITPVDFTAAGAQADIVIPTRRRGAWVLGPWRVERVDPWGLFRRQVAVIGSIEVLVTPKVRPVPLAVLPMTLTEHSGADEAGTTTFSSLREYVVGDELRHIHWRSSAKAGTLMTRQYVDITRPRITIVLIDDRGAYRDEDEFEDAVDRAASLAAVASTSGLDIDVALASGERVRVGVPRGTSASDFLALVQLHDTVMSRRLLAQPRATTVVVAGELHGGWWERIPASSVMRV